MTTRDVGDRVPVRYLAYAAGVATTATMALVVTAPDATTSNPSITPTAPNQDDASFLLSQAGLWSWVWTASGTIDDVATGQLTAVAKAPPPYASMDVLRAALGANTTDTTRDMLLARALDTASRSVEKYCDGREPGAFYLDTAPTARVFDVRRWVRCDPWWGEWVAVDDIGSITDLLVEVSSDNLVWTTLTDIETRPDNALVRGRAIDRLFCPSFKFSSQRLVRVTARWGWPAVPDEVEQATLLQASRLFKRKDSPEGVAGGADWGLIRVPNLDPDVKALLADFKSLMVA